MSRVAAIFARLTWLNSSSGAIVRRRERGSRMNARHELREPRVLPDVRLLVPVVLAEEPAVPDEQGRRVADLRRRPERRRRRRRRWEPGRVLDRRCGRRRPSSCSSSKSEPPSGTTMMPSSRAAGDDLLALLAARLLVALDGDGADRLEAPQVRDGVVERVDVGLEVPGGAVEDRAGREDARARIRPARASSAAAKTSPVSFEGSCDRRHAEGERGVAVPVLLRGDAVGAEARRGSGRR